MQLNRKSNCIGCKYLIVDHLFYSCSAFPKKNSIPAEIMNGQKKHDKVIEGQTGKFVFTKKYSDED